MQTEHRFFYKDSRRLDFLADGSVHLVVTSPPYPMIEMWDDTFIGLNGQIGEALHKEDYRAAFELMHRELDKVWKELFRLLVPGGFACINIGDAARSIGGRFQLFPNHYRIQQAFWENGFDNLPLILWRKQTNIPTKFMGSGMFPAGAYVTLEHEYILIFRKGAKRNFRTETEKVNRRKSAIFWEERNRWYSDLWDFKGVRQDIVPLNDDLRKRSGAFPFILPFRLLNMYSVYGDTVLDPFLGTGTTSLAALACGRNSIGCEIDANFAGLLNRTLTDPLLPDLLNDYQRLRVQDHLDFVTRYTDKKGHPPKYINSYYDFPVVTRQESNLQLFKIRRVTAPGKDCYKVFYNVFENC